MTHMCIIVHANTKNILAAAEHEGNVYKCSKGLGERNAFEMTNLTFNHLIVGPLLSSTEVCASPPGQTVCQRVKHSRGSVG